MKTIQLPVANSLSASDEVIGNVNGDTGRMSLSLLGGSLMSLGYLPRLTGLMDFEPSLAPGIVSYWEGDDITGVDGTALTQIPQTDGTADQFIGTSTLKTGSNGINGHKAISFNGSSDQLTTSTGGLSLSGDWYVAMVLQFDVTNGGFQSILSWGDSGVNGKRRTIAKSSDDFGHSLAFIGQFADVLLNAMPSLSANTTYLIEVAMVGNEVRGSVNGTLFFAHAPSDTLLNYSSDAIILGANLASGEFFDGKIAALFVSRTPSLQLQIQCQNYFAGKYNIAITGQPSLLNSSGNVGLGPIIDSDGHTVIGGGTPIGTGGTAMDFDFPAVFSVNGNLAAFAGGHEHLIFNRWAVQNVLAIWNRDPSGFSAIRFLHPLDGTEMCAIGYAPNTQPPWGDNTYGSFYFELSNFHDTTKYGIFRLIQTKVGTGSFLRMEVEQGGEIAFYGQDGSTEVLRLKNNGHVCMKNLPTSSSGLATGDIWNSSGTLHIV